jgi:hypothetical protein
MRLLYKKKQIKIMALPHITNSVAGRNLYDPYHNCLFEVYFTLPAALRAEFQQDEALITEHVLTINGLGALDKGPEASVVQKYQGTERSYLAPKMDSTSAELSVELSLNLRNGVDNYIYKLFKAWKNLNYDLETGTIVLKKDYVAEWLRVCVANRAGDIIKDVTFKDVMLSGGLDGLDDFAYDSNDAKNLTVKFKSDWWKEINA